MAAGDPVIGDSPITSAPSPVTDDPNFLVLSRSYGTVCHLGLLNPAPPNDGDPNLAQNLGPYNYNGTSAACHWWNARWCNRNGPIRINKSPRQLVDARRMFPYGASPVPIPSQPPRILYNQPMATSWLTIYMPTTGERPDIGLTTDASAYAMLGGDPGSMIDAALSAESCPFHFRDQSTDQPIDLIQYPGANAYDIPGRQGAPWLCKGPPFPSQGGYSMYGGGWQPQQAHLTEMSYVAHEFTGDLGFLEDLQYAANFVLIGDATLSSAHGKPIPYGEYRGLAWAVRTLFMAHIATRDAESAGIATGPGTPYKPSSYFKTLLDNTLAYYSPIMSDPAQQIFHTFVPAGTFAPWQCDYMLLAVAFGVLTGHSDWQPFFLWLLQNAIDRLIGTNGYPPAWAAYYLDGTQPSWAAAFNALQQNPQGGTPPTPEQRAALAADPFNGGIPLGTPEYLQTTSAVIAAAQHIDNLGICAIRAAFPNLDQCFVTVNTMIKNSSQEARHAITSDVSVVPTSIRQPSGGTSMDLVTGSVHTISVTNLKDAQGNAVTNLPASMVYTYTPSDASLVTMGAQNADGSQPFTVGATLGSLTFTGTLVYPDGSHVTLTPITVNIVAAAAPKAVTGDLTIT
jgi:hypothetical protein